MAVPSPGDQPLDAPPAVTSLKRAAALAALAEVQSGMVVGLGSGTTAEIFVAELGRRVVDGLQVVGVPTSERVAALARQHHVPLVSLDERPHVDLTVDGADEIEPHTLSLIKGHGGSLLREKLVAVASTREIIIADASKLVARLGARAPLPVEVVRFGWRRTATALERLGCQALLRQTVSGPFVSDEGHHILDCHFSSLNDPAGLAVAIKGLTGVVEHGLFIGIAVRAYVAASTGVVRLDVPIADAANSLPVSDAAPRQDTGPGGRSSG